MDDFQLDIYAMKNLEGVAMLEDYLRNKILEKKRNNVIKFAFTDTNFYWVEIFDKRDVPFEDLVPREVWNDVLCGGVIWTLDKVWFFKQTNPYPIKAGIRWDIDVPFLREVMYPFQYLPSRNT